MAVAGRTLFVLQNADVKPCQYRDCSPVLYAGRSAARSSAQRRKLPFDGPRSNCKVRPEADARWQATGWQGMPRSRRC